MVLYVLVVSRGQHILESGTKVQAMLQVIEKMPKVLLKSHDLSFQSTFKSIQVLDSAYQESHPN
jgi:hypothetical protein